MNYGKGVNYMEIPKIRGGWKSVPENLSDLSEMGFKPAGEVKALVWNNHIWVKLYELSEVIPKKRATELQLKALDYARAQAKENRRIANSCDECGEEVGTDNLKQREGHKICTWCIDKNRIAEMERVGAASFRQWATEDFIILDTETTGLVGAEIVEIGIIDRSGQILFDSLIKPMFPIPVEVQMVHGITNEMVKIAPRWSEVWGEVKRIIDGRLVLIYNAAYDCEMICNSCELYGIEVIPLRTDCVMEAYRNLMGADRWGKLSAASGQEICHRAVGDCEAVLKVLRDVWEGLGCSPYPEATADY
jgi:DNA polymerase-3 subunit epsilon